MASYHFHAWPADVGGAALTGWIVAHLGTEGSSNPQAGLDDLRSEFKDVQETNTGGSDCSFLQRPQHGITTDALHWICRKMR